MEVVSIKSALPQQPSMAYRVLYLTNRWPYPSGESFVSNEVRDLATHFSELVVLPTSMEPLGSHERAGLPTNVIVAESTHTMMLEEWGRRGLVRRGLAGCRHRGVLREVFASRPFSPRMVLGEAGQVVAMCDAIEQTLGRGLDEFDAVISFWLNRGASIGAELNRRHPHLSCFSRGHGGDIYAERSGLKHLPMQRTALHRLDGIISVSAAGADYLTTRYPELTTKTRVGRLGVDDQMACSPSQDGVLRILSISNLIPLKRVHLIAEALVHVQRPVKWSHIGDGDERSIIEQVLERVGDNVGVSLLGQLPHESVIDWLRENEVDVFVNVSTTEGVPVSIMEAFSFGIPVIATNVGGTREIVDDSCGVLLSADFTSEELGEVLEGWDSTNQALRYRALERQRGLYSSEKNQAAFATLIHDGIEKRREE